MPSLVGELVGATNDARIDTASIEIVKGDGTSLVDQVDALATDVSNSAHEDELDFAHDGDTLRAQRAKAISHTTAQEIELDSTKVFPTNRDAVITFTIWNENASFVKVPLSQEFHLGELLDKTEATAGARMLESDILPLRDLKILDTDGTVVGYINLGYATVAGATVFVITSTATIVLDRDISIAFEEDRKIYGGTATSSGGTLRLPWKRGNNSGVDALPVGSGDAPHDDHHPSHLPEDVIGESASITVSAADVNKFFAFTDADPLPYDRNATVFVNGTASAASQHTHLLRTLTAASVGDVAGATNSLSFGTVDVDNTEVKVGEDSNYNPIIAFSRAGTYTNVQLRIAMESYSPKPTTSHGYYTSTSLVAHTAFAGQTWFDLDDNRVPLQAGETIQVWDGATVVVEVGTDDILALTATVETAKPNDDASSYIRREYPNGRDYLYFGRQADNRILFLATSSTSSVDSSRHNWLILNKPVEEEEQEAINVAFDETLAYEVDTDGIFRLDPEASPIIPNRSYNIFDGNVSRGNITWHQVQNTQRSAKSTSGSPVASTLSNSIVIETDDGYSIRIGYYAESDEDYFQCALISDDPNAKASHVGTSVALRLETAPITDITSINFEHYFDQELTKDPEISVDANGNPRRQFTERSFAPAELAQYNKLKTLITSAYTDADFPASKLPYPTIEEINSPDQLANTDKYVFLGFVTASVSYHTETFHPGDVIVKVGADSYKVLPDGRARTIDLPTASTDFDTIGLVQIPRTDARVRFVVETVGSLQNRYARYGLGLGSILNAQGVSVAELNRELVAINFSMQTGDLDIYTSRDSTPARFWFDGSPIDLAGVGVSRGSGSVPWGSQPTARFYRFGLSETYMDNNLDHDVNIEFDDDSFVVGNPHEEIAKIPLQNFRHKIQQALFAVGTTPPASPINNERWESTIDQTLATFTSEDGSDATQAYSGDIFRYNGTRWVRIESQRNYRPIPEATLGNHARFPVGKMPLPTVLPDGQVPDAAGYDLGGRYQINGRPAELLATAPQTVATNDLNNLQVTLKVQGSPAINSYEASNPTAGDHNSNRFVDYIRQEHPRVAALGIATTTPNQSTWNTGANATIQVKFGTQPNVVFNRQDLSPTYQKGGQTYQRYAPAVALAMPIGKVDIRFFDAGGNAINFRDDRIYDAHEFVEVALRDEAVLKDQNIFPVLDVSGDPDEVYFGVSQHTNPQRDDFLIDIPASGWRGVRQQVQGRPQPVVNAEVPLLIANTNFDNGLYFARDFNQATGVAGHAVFYITEARQHALGILKAHISLSSEGRADEVVYDLSRHNNALGHFTGLITARQLDAKHQPETSASPGVPRNMTWRVNFETVDGSYISMTEDSVQSRREINPGKYTKWVEIFEITPRMMAEIQNHPDNTWIEVRLAENSNKVFNRSQLEEGWDIVFEYANHQCRPLWSRVPFTSDEWLQVTARTDNADSVDAIDLSSNNINRGTNVRALALDVRGLCWLYIDLKSSNGNIQIRTDHKGQWSIPVVSSEYVKIYARGAGVLKA